MTLNSLLKLMKPMSEADATLMQEAFLYAQRVHEGQVRGGGEPFFTHPFEVARLLAEWDQSPATVIAGLLHNTTTVGGVSLKELEDLFGAEIMQLVKGVNDLAVLKYREDGKHAEAMRKVFVSIAKDARAMIIAFANRIHNMTTIGVMPMAKRRSIALETLEVHTRLAERLGMGRVKSELEQLAFPHFNPEKFAEIKAYKDAAVKKADKGLEKVYRSLRRYFAKENVQLSTMEYRLKSPYSLYKKIERYKRENKDHTNIHDILAIRVVVNTTEDCYRILGLINSKWRPVPGGIKDYIATPKPNGYQSIHVAIFTGGGSIAEIQIRTEKMHQEAEYGIASHIAYVESGKSKAAGELAKKLSWIDDLLKQQQSSGRGEEFSESLEVDFFGDRIFVFTPKGDVLDLPEGSTPLDFAYRIHSKIGDRAIAAVIDEKYKGLDTVLSSGQTVRIETQKNARPNKKWLNFVRTPQARRKIRLSLKE